MWSPRRPGRSGEVGWRSRRDHGRSYEIAGRWRLYEEVHGLALTHQRRRGGVVGTPLAVGAAAEEGEGAGPGEAVEREGEGDAGAEEMDGGEEGEQGRGERRVGLRRTTRTGERCMREL